VGTFRQFRRPLSIALLIGVVGARTLTSAQAPPSKPPTPPPDAPRTLRISAEEAQRIAKEARQGLSVELAPGLDVTLWAPEQLVVDPVAIDFDDRGAAYVAGTSRNNLPLDIRQHPDWVPLVHTLHTVEDLRNFYRKELAPERSAQNGWIADLNNDGSRDLRDFRELKERIYRIEDSDGDSVADTSHILVEGFNDDPTYDVAGGILYHDGELFAGVPPGVFRLTDPNNDGRIDGREVVSEGYNVHPAFGGHGISGVIVGPDGRLYWEVGDMGFSVVDKDGRRHQFHNQGAVLRSNLDGSGFEVFATGIRNLQEFAFDEFGNLISVDNDGDHQGEYERLVYIPEGSDSGWRSNWQYGKYTDQKNNRYNVWMDEEMFKPRFDGQAAHIIPPIAPYHAGPSGMVYNPGTALSEEWRNHFFVSSFPGAASNARVYGFRLKEDGAGFTLESDKVVVRGILVVGMTIGPDGALYLTDWITGWDSKNNGRLWKLDAPKAAADPIRTEVKSLIAENFANRASADLSALLRHVDMRIRQKAQFELARRADVQTLLAAANDGSHLLRRVHGIWGIGQLARKNPQHAPLLTPFLKDGDKEIRAQAAKLVGDLRASDAGAVLVPLLKDDSARVRFFAAEALGRLAYKPAVAQIVEMLAANDDKDLYLRHAGALALSRIGDAADVAALSDHTSGGVRIAAIVALRRMRSPEVARFLSDRDEKLVVEAARAINDDGGIDGAVPALARVLEGTRSTSEPLLRRAINANLRQGAPEGLTRLAAFAEDTARSEPMRLEAIASIGVWPAPSPHDRVDGMYTAPQGGKRDVVAARTAIVRLIQAQPDAAGGAPLKIALAEAAGRLHAAEAAPILLAQLRSDTSAEVRGAALRALHALKPSNMSEVMKIAFADADANVRREALRILPTLPLANAAKLKHLSSVLRTGTLQDQQTAIEVIGGMKTPGAVRVLGTLLDDLAAGKLAPELQIDLVDAVQSSGSAPLQARLEAYRKSRKAQTLTDAFRGALLRGGDARRGRDIFANHPAAACTRCHTLRGRGTDVGPNLTNIASTLTREQLLESLLEPNTRIAPGYGTVGITLRNGQKVDGMLRSETDTHVIVTTGTPPVEQRIVKSEIAERTNPVSAMPPMGALLKPREIRDVIEFLGLLR
jgi:quinoprotein glucose dehydrogenase